MRKLSIKMLVGIIGLFFVISPVGIAKKSISNVVLNPDIKWHPLNPARGDKSPKAANIWGDRTNSGPSGFLVKFVDGFESPPHTHNVSYRGIVIRGLVHNADPTAKNRWLPVGSFWTQPAGDTHVTAAKGEENIAYIEIEDGPYLVKPESEVFDNGERPINVDKSNLVWLNASDISWIEQGGIEVAFLWGSAQPGKLRGYLIKVPAGVNSQIVGNGTVFHGVVIQGHPIYQEHTLEPGNYVGFQSSSICEVISDKKEESIFYVRTNGKLDIKYKLNNQHTS